MAKAVEQAKAGDAKAREWLGKMLVGSDPIPLAELVEELQAELLRIKYGKQPEGNGTAAPGGFPRGVRAARYGPVRRWSRKRRVRED